MIERINLDVSVGNFPHWLELGADGIQDAAIIYTESKSVGGNQFFPRNSIVTRYATKIINPNYYQTIKIKGSD